MQDSIRLISILLCYFSVVDAARLADELRQEQEHAVQVERLRKGLEQQIKDLQTRLDEAEANAIKGGKRIIAKLEQRVRKEKKRIEVDIELLFLILI